MKMKQCPMCKGDGGEICGEYFVTQDMAIDGGDRSLEGEHYSYDIRECPECGGAGQIPNP